MKFGLFYTKTLKKSKTAITFAYDVEKKRIIYQTEEHDEESSIWSFLKYVSAEHFSKIDTKRHAYDIK